MNEIPDDPRENAEIDLADGLAEDWQADAAPERPALRRQAVILLIVLLLPTLLILIEALTGGVTPFIRVTKTAIPQWLPAVHF